RHTRSYGDWSSDVCSSDLQNFAPVERGTQKRRGVAALGTTFLLGAMHDKGGADRGARIMRRGGYEHIGEIARLADQLVGHAVERDAAGKAQMVERHLAFEAPDERHDRRIRGLLQRSRNIGVSRQNLHARVPRRTQQGPYSTQFGRLKADRLRVHCIILLADADDRLEFATEDLGIAVGCQTHELRGVVGGEAKITADDLPYEAKRVRIVEGFDRLYVRAVALRQGRGGRLAQAVDDEDGRAIEA